MDRGLVVGGALICASFLIAVGLNQSRRDDPQAAPKKAVEQPASAPATPPNLLECLDPDDEARAHRTPEQAPPCE
jgi:hypothetical protein